MNESHLPTESAPSPFHPGTARQFAWDSTSLGYFKECPRKYYYTMVKGYRAKGESVHLTWGSWYHKALEDYDHFVAQGRSHADALHFVVAWIMEVTWVREPNGAGQPWTADHNTKTRENLVRSVIWYLEQFGPNDPTSTVILRNGKPAVELSFRIQVDEDLILCGHLDRVVEFQGQQYVMDRKTSSSTISSYYFDQYSPDNQMSLYTLAGGIITENPIRGVVIDAVQIAVGFSRFERGMVYRTEAQTQEWLADTKVWIAQAHAAADRGQWPMNDKSCHKFGGCPFRQICSSDPRVRETFLAQNFQISHWNPLEVR